MPPKHDGPHLSAWKPLGWWTISGEDLLGMLHRVNNGENPDLVYAEEYANGEHVA